MYKKSLFALGFIGLLFSSCIEHEVIPAPELTVDLYAHFEGYVGGQFVEYTENVDSYYGYSELSTQSSGGVNNAQYFFSMISPSFVPSIKIGVGSMVWNNASGTTIPALSLFNGFFAANDLPAFSDQALNGFEMTYHSLSGRDFASRENSINLQNVEFTNIVQESDKYGDYSKFICTFDGYVYNSYVDEFMVTITDSLHIDQAVFEGWFQR